MSKSSHLPESDAIERAARAIAGAADDECFDRIDAGEADDGSGDWEDADYYRRLARAAHGAITTPEAHEFTEDVNDASMCVCGVPALTHDQVYPPAPQEVRDV